jgi:hypothetical protein
LLVIMLSEVQHPEKMICDWSRLPGGLCFAAGSGADRDSNPLISRRGERIRESLGWTPRYDDLATICRHALEWQRKLMRRNASPLAAVARI